MKVFGFTGGNTDSLKNVTGIILGTFVAEVTQGEFKGSHFNYIVPTVLPPQGTKPSSKARCSGETYKFVSDLRCNDHFPFLVTRLKFVPVPM